MERRECDNSIFAHIETTFKFALGHAGEFCNTLDLGLKRTSKQFGLVGL